MIERVFHLGGTKHGQFLPVNERATEMRYPIPPLPILVSVSVDEIPTSIELEIDSYRRVRFANGDWTGVAFVHSSLDDSAATRALFENRAFESEPWR